MDPFAHFSTGATIGTILLKDTFSFLGETNSLLISLFLGGIIGILPDIDILYKKLISNIYYFEKHRTWTHSLFIHLPFSILISLLIILYTNNDFSIIVIANYTLYIISILLSHIILDALTSWGVYYFYPLKTTWATKSTSVIDLIFNLLMSLQLLTLFLFKENYIFFILATLYLLSLLAVRQLYITPFFKKELIRQKIQYTRIDIKPIFSNGLIWTINIEQEDNYLSGYYSILQKNKKVHFFQHKYNLKTISTNNLQISTLIKRLAIITDNWYSISVINNQICINDIRYGLKTFSNEEEYYGVIYKISDGPKGLDVTQFIKPPKGWFYMILKRIFTD